MTLDGARWGWKDRARGATSAPAPSSRASVHVDEAAESQTAPTRSSVISRVYKSSFPVAALQKTVYLVQFIRAASEEL